MMNTPARHIYWIIKKYFIPPKLPVHDAVDEGPTYNIQSNDKVKVTETNITHEEVAFITDTQTLRDWAAFSMEQRCVMFHRKYLSRRIKPWLLRKVMYQAGLRRKAVIVANVPNRLEARQEEFADKILELDLQVKEILDGKGHLIFSDESIFTGRGFQMQAWSRRGENIRVQDRTGNQPCQAVCAAICTCHKVLVIKQVDYAFTAESYCEFLEDVVGACGKEKIYLFQDNAR